MRFKNNIINSKVSEAIKKAESILMAGSNMINELAEKDDFKYNSGHGVQVALNLILVKEPINVYTYKSINPFSKAIGYYDGEAIWINSRKMQAMDINSLVGLFIHEYSHYCGYGHGNNYKSQEKCLYSVPYYLSENVARWV